MALDNPSNLFKYWGKAKPSDSDSPDYHPLVYHSLDVAAVGQQLLSLDSLFQKKMIQLSGLSAVELMAICPFFLTLHDIGKFSDAFQNLKPELFERLRGESSAAQYSIRHDSMGFFIWENLLYEKTIKESWLPRIEDEVKTLDQWGLWIQAVTGHHGKPPELPLTKRIKKYLDSDTQKDIETFTKDAADLFLLNVEFPSFKDNDLNFERLSWPLAGFAVLCDWLGSNSDIFHYRTQQIPLKKYYQEVSLPCAKKVLIDSGILPVKTKQIVTSSVLFPQLNKLSPLQDFVTDCSLGHGPQLFILEDATGSGKTEAALILASRLINAEKASGLYFALPTMATANAIYDRLSSVYQNIFDDVGNPSLLLAHSSRHLSESFRNTIRSQYQPTDSNYDRDEETASVYCNAWLADSRKKALLASVGVGTIDQALMAALASKHQSLRLFGLMRSVLIVDEVHSYDSYSNELLASLIRFQASQGGSVILLSATLPQSRKNELACAFRKELNITKPVLKEVGYPLAIRVEAGAEEETVIEADIRSEKRTHIEWAGSLEQVETILLDAYHKGICSCWVRNTVQDAIDSYVLLRKKIPEENIILFHARFAMGDRLEIESQVLQLFGAESDSEDRAGKILIATQIVEQSLDLDFDVMVSDLAPIDLLIQRSGRLHRHLRDAKGYRISDGNDQRGKSVLTIHGPDPVDNPHSKWYRDYFPRGSYVYPSHGQLWATAKLLKQKGMIRIPEDARELIEGVYGENGDIDIPDSFQEIDLTAYGKSISEKSNARFNALNLDAGYSHSQLQWMDDTKAPTRLGLPTKILRLARWNGYALTPWVLQTNESWELSEVRVRSIYANEESKPKDPSLIKAMNESKESMPDQCKWSLFVPLFPGPSNTWSGEAINEKGEAIQLRYSKELGLQFTELGIKEEP